MDLLARQRSVRGRRGLPLRGRGLPRRPGLRSGQHDRGIQRKPRTRPQQLCRPAGHPVLRRHDGVVGRRYPPRAVALGHGPDAVLRRDRRAGQAVVEGLAHRMPIDVGGGQLVGGVGVRGVRPAGRSAAQAAASGQGRRRTGTARRARAGHRSGFRRPGAGAGGDQRRLSTCRRRSPGSTSSTNRAPPWEARCCPSRRRRPVW